MALVTIQRSPTPSTDPDLDVFDSSEDTSDGRSQLRKRSKTSKDKLKKNFSALRFISKLRPCLSESYFTVKGAALILPHTECTKKTTKKSHGGEIQSHLQAMLHLLRQEDTIKIAVRLEDTGNYQCYMALVSTRGRQDTEEAVILGIDCTGSTASIGLVLPMWMGLRIKLGGDGGFSLCSDEQSHLFKPVSVQAMWSAIQSLYRVLRIAEEMKYIPDGLTHTWVGYYRSRINNRDSVRMCQWNVEGIEIFAPSSLSIKANDSENERIKLTISQTLKEVMMTFDLDEVTSIMLRNASEQKMGISLTAYKSYFDEEVMRIVGQMDKPSKILDFLYLGSEWNASNLEELIEKGVGYILNVTKEIDNFFEGRFQYYNVRVYDVDESDLLKHWDKTYKFISKARSHDSKVLVHCKMGVSRSASTVMAFIMKDQRMTVDEAYQFVKEQRNCVHPNSGFMEQLRTYEGILTASNKRDIFRSKSEQNLLDEGSREDTEASQGYFLGDSLFHMMSHTDWQSASEGVSCHEECISLLHKDEMYNLDILAVDTDLEAAESRSADSTKEALPDVPCQTTPEVIIALQPPSAPLTATAPVPIIRPTLGAPSSVREATLDRDSSSELESYTAMSSSEGSSSLQLRASIGAVGPRIKPDSSWIKLEAVEMEKGETYADNLLFTDTLPLDYSSSGIESSVSGTTSSKSSSTLLSSQCDVVKLKTSTEVESSVAPTGIPVLGFLPISTSPANFSSRSLSPEKSVTESCNSGVNFQEGPPQVSLDVNPVFPVTADSTVASSTTITKSSSGQKKSSATTSFSSDLFTETQNVAVVKQTPEEHVAQCALQNLPQKEPLEKSPNCGDNKVDRQETDAQMKEESVGASVGTSRSPQYRIEPGVRQYFFREKIPWKPGKVKKMQEDINKTGQISQDEEDKSIEDKDKTECHADLSDEWTLLEQTCEHQPAVSLCQSHSCVELSSAEEIESNPMSVYEREEIPLTVGTVLRTRLEIEERQRLFCGEGDQELFGTSRPVLRTSSLKQERCSSRSRYTDNRRLTCGPIMSPGKSLDESLGFAYEQLFDTRSPVTLTQSQLEYSDEELADKLESKYEADKAHPRASGRSSSPINIKAHSPASAVTSPSQGSLSSMTLERALMEDTENNLFDSLSSWPESQPAAGLNLDPYCIVRETGSPILMSSSPPQPKDVEETEPCANMVKYFVRKIEKQAVVSTATRNSAVADTCVKATSPVRDESNRLRCQEGECINRNSAYVSLDTDTYTQAAHPIDFILTSSTGSATLSTGSATISTGLAPISAGLTKKSTGSSSISTGSAPISAGPTTIFSESAPISTGSATIYAAPEAVSTGLAPISTGLAPISTGLAHISTDFSISKDARSDTRQEITQLTEFETNTFENSVLENMSASRTGLDLKLEAQTAQAQHVSNQTLESMRNVSLSSPGSRVKEQVAALADTAKPDQASSPRASSHIVDDESPEPFVVKHLVGRFESKSPQSDRVSSNSSHDLILRLKELRDISISSLTASLKTHTEEQTPTLSSLEDTTKLTSATINQSLLRPIDNLSLNPCSSSMTSTTPVSSSSICSSVSSTFIASPPLVSPHRRSVSLDSPQSPACASRKFPITIDIEVELQELSSESDSLSTGEASDPPSVSSRKFGPVPFDRSVMESPEKKTWRSVRPKSADHIHVYASCSKNDCSSSDTLLTADIMSSCSSFHPVDDDSVDDTSLRQVSEQGRKIRRLHGKSHPLNKLSEHCLGNPFFSSM